MTIVHLHLLANHFPILGSIFVTALFLVALVLRNPLIQKISLWFLVFIALTTAVAYFSGDQSVNAVRGLADISQPMIEQHASAARTELILMFFTGVVALGSALFYLKRPKFPIVVLATVLILLLANSAFSIYVGFLGGQIHHPEIRSLIETSLVWM